MDLKYLIKELEPRVSTELEKHVLLILKTAYEVKVPIQINTKGVIYEGVPVSCSAPNYETLKKNPENIDIFFKVNEDGEMETLSFTTMVKAKSIEFKTKIV